MKKQSVTLTFVTPDNLPDVRTVDCFVFGVWAVHRPHPDENHPNYWHVTHIPTSALAVVTERYTEALKAARLLATIEPPDVSVKVGSDGRLSLSKVPRKWGRLSLEMVSGLDVYICRRGYLTRP